MSDTKLADLAASGALTGTELFYADNGSVDVKVTTNQIRAFATTARSGFYYATDYGVTADGVTDDTSAIQTALNVAGVTGGSVFLPGGTCLIGSTITIPTGVVLEGAGGVAQIALADPTFYPSRLKWTGSSSTGIIVDTDAFTQGSGIRNLTIDGSVSSGSVDTSMLKAIRLQSGYQHVLINVGMQNVGVGVSMEPSYGSAQPLIENIWSNNVSMHLVNIGFDIGPNVPVVDRNATGSFALNATAIPISNTAGYTTAMSLFDISKPSALGPGGRGIPITAVNAGVGVTISSTDGYNGATAASAGAIDHLVAIQNIGGVTNCHYFNTWIINARTSAIRIGPLCDDNRFTGGYAECQVDGNTIINIGWLYPTIGNGAFACAFYNFELEDNSTSGCTGITYGNSTTHANRFSGIISTQTKVTEAGGGLGLLNYEDDWNRTTSFTNDLALTGNFTAFLKAFGNETVNGGGMLLWGSDFFGAVSPSTMAPDAWALGRSPDGATFVNTLQWTEAGSVILGDGAPDNAATDGFVYIPTCAGTPSGTPTSFPGWSPMVFDAGANKLYIYNSGWKSVTVS